MELNKTDAQDFIDEVTLKIKEQQAVENCEICDIKLNHVALDIVFCPECNSDILDFIRQISAKYPCKVIYVKKA